MNRGPLTTCGSKALQEYTIETWIVDEAIQASKEVTLAQTPPDNSLLVFLNGLLLQVGATNDYTLAGLTLEFTDDSLFPGDIITARYTKD